MTNESMTDLLSAISIMRMPVVQQSLHWLLVWGVHMLSSAVLITSNAT